MPHPIYIRYVHLQIQSSGDIDIVVMHGPDSTTEINAANRIECVWMDGPMICA
ncbi:hypothetical protein GLOTRDRAFT_112241 [Gloeophyllum trabeum ATCC 11539]|uniref:Uncharacterized protein n=1 Tax=Gloeophyllum trabeum (strain ATCC 11539 / FP-39264 / Madison 617) TaxID=670483 RepID=S7RI56_GLOTA|nr:uncharacterized protein GLOTRDRAFT_112241 [Gloeophyllum trabeum ATCC 11539]EPQ52294.1 hypothetical protein GLOTRDRAFT_112241 [Gloeophyllum trabeum ATCC 11539]